jgi:DNA-binding response OmpR family regulator
VAQTNIRGSRRGSIVPASSSSIASGIRPTVRGHYPAPRVLLADAHPDTRELYAVWLTQRGFVVSTAASAGEISAVASTEPPDVIVTELMLPGGGPALVRSLRAHATTADAVVIVLTTQTSVPLREQALAAGADCYLVKPCGAPRLGDAMVSASRARFRDAMPGERRQDAVLRAAQRAFAIRERVATGAVPRDPIID